MVPDHLALSACSTMGSLASPFIDAKANNTMHNTLLAYSCVQQQKSVVARLQFISVCPMLQADLAAKYVDIFHKYSLDLADVQTLYEKHKHAPPVVRNAPPVAGNIMWARQLLRRIELPMTRSVLACFLLQHALML